MSAAEPVEGQAVTCMHSSWTARRDGVVVAYVPPAAASGHDYPAWIVAYPPSDDEHPAVQALAIYDGLHRGLFRADELGAVVESSTAVTTVEATVAETATDDVPDGGVTWWECPRPGCDTVMGEAGPVDPDDDYDPVREHVEGHERDDERRGVWLHEVCRTEVKIPDGGDLYDTIAAHEASCADVRGIVGEVSAVGLWLAVGEHKQILDGLAVNADRRSFAAALRAVADVIEGGAQ